MNIVMLSNTFTPHVGGVARSIESFAQQYRKLGHEVLIVAPEFDNIPGDETNVLRIPALQNFNGSDFSVVLPVSGLLTDALDSFQPDIVHSHHPFLLGMTALRIARFRQLPLVFTHHTLYEQYTHYVPGDSPTLWRFAIKLATGYANLADRVFAPSESIAQLLRERGVLSPINVVPTGVELDHFSQGDGLKFREQTGIPKNAFLVGHLGRLAPEKNLSFLASSVAKLISTDLGNQEPTKGSHDIHFLVVGSGPSESDIRAIFELAGFSSRLHIAGILTRQQLSDAYHAMDVFAFASKSETQGMVLTEAMAAGIPVVALDAPGAREVVQDQLNGRLLSDEDPDIFAQALKWIAEQPESKRRSLSQSALATAENFSIQNTAELALGHYTDSLNRTIATNKKSDGRWTHLLELIKAEWDIIEGVAGAAGSSLSDGYPMSETYK